MASLVLAAHGSLTHPGAARAAFEHTDRLRDLDVFESVKPSFWKEAPTFREVLRTVRASPIYVVPLFTSEGYFTKRVLPRELRLTGDDRLDVVGPVHLTRPVGTHPAMTDVIVSRAERLIDRPTEEVGLAVVGHGTERSETSAAATREHAERIRSRGRFAAVDALFLDEAPYIGEVYERLDTRTLVVVPHFVADGEHTTEDIPEALGLDGPTDEPVTVDGRTVHYAGAVGTDPTVVDVILDRVADAGDDVAPPRGQYEDRGRGDVPVRGDGALGEPERPFLDWVESGLDTDRWQWWGELAIGRAAAAPNRYECRHIEDRASDRAALVDLDDPPALRDHARFDDEGHYRPLATVPSLPTGWCLDGLDDRALVAAVEWVYPATVTNWFLGRQGDLDVTHWADAAARHTGRYGDLDELDPADVTGLVERHCVDAACIKRRTWAYDDKRPIDVPGGEGKLPCREPCPYLLEAARAHLDGELPAGERFDPVDHGTERS